MIAYLKGSLIYKGLDSLIVDVNGVGYQVFCPPSFIAQQTVSGKEPLVLWCETILRENSATLYGFDSTESCKLFKVLTSVSGVGPKVALSILSVCAYGEIVQSIMQNQLQNLTKAEGVGKKLAQRIVHELQDKVKKLSPPQEGGLPRTEDPLTEENLELKELAIQALVQLGYSRYEVAGLVAAVVEKGGAKKLSLSDAVSQSLKALSFKKVAS